MCFTAYTRFSKRTELRLPAPCFVGGSPVSEADILTVWETKHLLTPGSCKPFATEPGRLFDLSFLDCSHVLSRPSSRAGNVRDQATLQSFQPRKSFLFFKRQVLGGRGSTGFF